MQDVKNNLNNDENTQEFNDKSNHTILNEKPILNEIFKDKLIDLKENLQVIY